MFDAQLKNRYVIAGTLTLCTPLHVGSGQGNEFTDAAVVKYLDGKPYVPGSSFKGVFRSTVERLAEALDYTTCWLEEGMAGCLTTDPNLAKAFGLVREAMGHTIQAREQDRVQALRTLGVDDWIGRHEIKDERLADLLGRHLCDVCKTFGSPFAASKVLVEDLRLNGANQPPNRWTDIRDGVGIDRDTGTAREKVKFDFETVSAEHSFRLQMLVENADIAAGNRSTVLALVALGLNEFLKGARLGGITSRGLGWCQLESVQARLLDFQNGTPQDRLNLLLTRNINQLPAETGEQFIARWLKCKEG